MKIVNRTRSNRYLIDNEQGASNLKDGLLSVYMDKEVNLVCYDWDKRKELNYRLFGCILKITRAERKKIKTREDFSILFKKDILPKFKG